MGFVKLFAILAFWMMVLVFYVFLKIFIGNTTYKVTGVVSGIEGYESLLDVLKTSVDINIQQITIAELIALVRHDEEKKTFLEKELVKLMDDVYGTSNCVIMCISNEKIKGSGCGAIGVYQCSINYVTIPGYDKNPIEVSFDPDAQPLSSPIAP